MPKTIIFKKIKYALEAILVKVFFTIFKILPIDVASDIGGLVARNLGPLFKVSKVAERNLIKIMPELDENKRKKIILDMWQNLGRVAAEFPHIYKLSAEQFNQRVVIEGADAEALHHYRQQGAIFFSGHIGNWEVAPRLPVEQGFEVSLIYRHANNKIVDHMMCAERSRQNIAIIPKGEKSARQIIAALKNKKILAMLVDQKMNDGINVPFLGHDAMTAPAIARLALNFKCPLVPIQVIRTCKANFKIKIHPALKINETNHREQDIYQIMSQINGLIGGWIKENPAQWFWLHKRWK